MITNKSMIFEGHVGQVNSICFSGDGKMLVSCSDDATIIFWDSETGEKLGEPLLMHNSGVNCICLSPDGKYIIAGSEDQTISITKLDIVD